MLEVFQGLGEKLFCGVILVFTFNQGQGTALRDPYVEQGPVDVTVIGSN